jgi:hypothetical protein
MNTRLVTFLFAALLWSGYALAIESVSEQRDANENARISLAAVTGSIDIIGHDAEQLSIEGTLGDDIEALIIEGDAEHWQIEVRPLEDYQWTAETQATELTLYVPLGADLEAAIVSGALHVQSLQGPSVELGSVSGNITLEDIAADSISAQSVSGEIIAGQAAGEVNQYQSVNGNITIQGAAGRIEITSVSGLISLQAAQLSELRSETVSGALRARLAALPRASIEVSSHSGLVEVLLAGDATPRIRAETFSGRIDSNFGDADASGFTNTQSLRVDGSPDAVDIEAETFSGPIVLKRAN